MGTKISLSRHKALYPGYPPEFDDAFRRYIHKRDDYKCSICNAEHKMLNVHHIDYIKKNTTKLNCITLCRDCHQMIHFQCGWVQRVVWKYKLWEITGKREMSSGKERISQT